VFHNRGAIRSTTGRERSIPDALRPENEVPRSPCTTLPIHCAYRIYAGSSSPSSRRNAATVSLVAACPSTASPKSPGNISIAEKIMIETINSVASPKPKRSRTVLNTGCKGNHRSVRLSYCTGQQGSACTNVIAKLAFDPPTLGGFCTIKIPVGCHFFWLANSFVHG